MSRPLLVAYRALGLGDLLTGIPALRALARAFPEHRRVLAAPEALAPLALLSGAVDEVIDARALEPLPAAAHGADVAVNLHGRGSESHEVLLAARPGRLIAFASGAVPGPLWHPGEHEVLRWCRLLEESDIPADPEDLDLPAPPGPVREDLRGATVIHPGAASGARRWPAERWAEVARAERAAGRTVVLTGSASERALALDIAAAAGVPEAHVLAGRTELLELAAVVAAAGRVACGDTGVGHLATALGVPSVLLFGPVPPAEWGPPPSRPRNRALWAGRRGDPHAEATDPGLLAIGAGEVVHALHAEPARERVGIAVISRNRRDGLLATLARLIDLPQRPPIAVVDDASSDGTADAVRRHFPEVTVARTDAPTGAAARTIAARLLDTPVVAFADDDSWWAPDALDVIGEAFARDPRLGLVAGRVLVGPEERLDPVCDAMRTSPLGGDAPGPRILGFVACGAAVRREAFLAVGGFDRRFGVGGEEELLSIDLAAAGWELRYLDEIVAHHHPDTGAARPQREVTSLRNALWVLWLRRRAPAALAGTVRALALARVPTGRRALLAALRGAPRALVDRRPVPEHLERDLRLLDAAR